tara:strand:- start:38 stop:448 length:411 start_codon:yes stop_codon:yes gene_type:complete
MSLKFLRSVNCLLILLFFQIILFTYIIKELYIAIFIIIAEIILFSVLKDLNYQRDIDVDDITVVSRSISINSDTISYADITSDDIGNFEFCSICLDEEKNNLSKLECGHLYHKNCIEEWLEKDLTCPICRNNIAIV